MDEISHAPHVDAGRRRTRFNASADLKLMQLVRVHEPYAAEHGSKLKVWERVAEELQRSVSDHRPKTRPITSRAVSDRCVTLAIATALSLHLGEPCCRFHLLVKMHVNGRSYTETSGAKDTALMDVMLREVADRMHLASSSRGKPSPKVLVCTQSPETMAMNAATELTIAELQDDDNDPLPKADDDDDAGVSSLLLPDHDDSQQQYWTSQLVALKREKLRLKKRKLAMLAQHHEEQMALQRQRLDLEERKFHEEALSRRSEWQSLLMTLRGGVDLPHHSSSLTHEFA